MAGVHRHRRRDRMVGRGQIDMTAEVVVRDERSCEILVGGFLEAAM